MNTYNEHRIKVALVADVRNWAYSNIAVSLRKYLSDKFDIVIKYMEDYTDYNLLFIDLFAKEEYDLVHFFWRETVFTPEIFNPFNNFNSLKEIFEQVYYERLTSTCITASVYDHLYLEPDDIKCRRGYYNYFLSGYTVSSEKLKTIYSGFVEYTNPDAVIEDGVDLELFYPKNIDRLYRKNKELIIGWVGNSNWGAQDGIDRKGLHTIIKPALEILQSEGYIVKSLFADRNERFIPQIEMVDYYKNIDVMICASDIEGTPNPVLEAMACGVPIVSTDVGIVPQVFGPLQLKFIMKNRTVEALVDKIKVLMSNPDKLVALSTENIESIKKWTREEEAKKWEKFFIETLAKDRNSHYKNCLSSFFCNEARVLGQYKKWIATNEKMIDERDDYIKKLEKMVNEKNGKLRGFINISRKIVHKIFSCGK